MDIKKHKTEIFSSIGEHEGLKKHFTNLFKSVESTEASFNILSSPKITEAMKPRFINDLKVKLQPTWEQFAVDASNLINELNDSEREQVNGVIKNFKTDYFERFKCYQEATTVNKNNGNMLYSDRKPPKAERKLNENAVNHSEKLKGL